MVGLTIRETSNGDDELLIYLRDLESEESTGARVVAINVNGRTLGATQCGPTCRTVSADLRGGERVEGRSGSYRLDELLTAGLGTSVRATYAFLAPNRYRFGMEQPGGDTSDTIVIGGTRYLRSSPDGPWEEQTGAPELSVPSFIWDSFEPFTDPKVLGGMRVDDVQTTEVTFFGGEQRTPVWFRLWIDDRGLVRRAEMRAQGHFMDHRYFDFDEPISIRPPT